MFSSIPLSAHTFVLVICEHDLYLSSIQLTDLYIENYYRY